MIKLCRRLSIALVLRCSSPFGAQDPFLLLGLTPMGSRARPASNLGDALMAGRAGQPEDACALDGRLNDHRTTTSSSCQSRRGAALDGPEAMSEPSLISHPRCGGKHKRSM